MKRTFNLPFRSLIAGLLVTFAILSPQTMMADDGAVAVDLGLPSGTKWADRNVGASKPEEYGGYYAWGETEEKEVYSWNNYSYLETYEKHDGYSVIICKDIGNQISGTQYDVAHTKWGGEWRMPTKAEMEELLEYCITEATVFHDVQVMKFTGPSGNSILFPFPGAYFNGDNGEFINEGYCTMCWSGDLDSNFSPWALAVYNSNNNYNWVGLYGSNAGFSVRPVLCSPVIDDIKLGTQMLLMAEGETIGLTYKPANVNASDISWTSSDESVAKVDINGNVSANREGTCTITASYRSKQDICKVIVSNITGFSNGHDYVDLGLPSGTLWATMNLGAERPDDFGLYFQWGEVSAQNAEEEPFAWTNYILCNGSGTALTKYCSNQSLWAGAENPDGLNELSTDDDAANVLWGASWRIPSVAQIEEITDQQCTEWEQTSMNGLAGYLVRSRTNGNCIFLPVPSYYIDSYMNDTGSYWSRSLSDVDNRQACVLFPAPTYFGIHTCISRCHGLPIRPVFEGLMSGTGLSISTGRLDFGSVVIGNSRSLSFDIVNNTHVPQTILPINIGNEEFNIDWTGGDIQPNSSQRVTVTFSPTTKNEVCGESLDIRTSEEAMLVTVTASSHKRSSELTSKADLVVWCKDGSKVAYTLNKRPIVTISESKLKIECISSSAEYDFGDILKLTYEGIAVDVPEINHDERPPYSFTSEALTFFSDKERLDVQIVSMDGMVVRRFSVLKGTTFTLPLIELHTGAYVINVNKVSYKIIKR